MQKKLKIIVVGEVNTGKTTVSLLIEQALKNLCKNVVVEDQDELTEFDKEMSLTHAAESLQDLEVEIVQQQLARDRNK